VTGPVRRLSQCHPTITNSYTYSWIRNSLFLELRVIITTNTQTQPDNFEKISRRNIIPADLQDFQEC